MRFRPLESQLREEPLVLGLFVLGLELLLDLSSCLLAASLK
jgi:hypothetical protein